MARVLVVTLPFADFAKGAVISDPETIRAVEAANPSHVVAANHDVPDEIVIETVAEEAAPAAPAPHRPTRKRA